MRMENEKAKASLRANEERWVVWAAGPNQGFRESSGKHTDSKIQKSMWKKEWAKADGLNIMLEILQP